MGRGKLMLKLIENEKSRATTYQKRKRGLKKKAEEFATLCGVPTCMVLFGPRFRNHRPEVDVWPRDVNRFMEVVNLYREKGYSSSRATKAYNMLDFFSERKRKVEEKASRLRKANLELKFSGCWDDRFNGLSVDQLRVLLLTIDHNIEAAARKIIMVKGEPRYHHQDCPTLEFLGGNSYGSQLCLSPPDHQHRNFEWQMHAHDLMNRQLPISSMRPPDHYMQLCYTPDHHYHQHHHQQHQHQAPALNLLPFHDLNPNNDQVANGGSGNDHNHHLLQFGQGVVQPAFCLDPTALVINNQRVMYFPSMQPFEHEYPPQPLPSNVTSSHQMHYGSNDFYRDMNDFEFKNQIGKL